MQVPTSATRSLPDVQCDVLYQPTMERQEGQKSTDNRTSDRTTLRMTG